MRFLKDNNLKRQSDNYELVTFGHGQKRCVGEKMARAMICAFVGTIVPDVNAEAPEHLPADDNLFDLIPASKLRLFNLKEMEEEGSDHGEQATHV